MEIFMYWIFLDFLATTSRMIILIIDSISLILLIKCQITESSPPEQN